MQELLRMLSEVLAVMSTQPEEGLVALRDIAQRIYVSNLRYALLMILVLAVIVVAILAIGWHDAYLARKLVCERLGADVWKQRRKLWWYVPAGLLMLYDCECKVDKFLIFLKEGEECPDPARLIRTQAEYNEYCTLRRGSNSLDVVVIGVIIAALMLVMTVLAMLWC